MYDADDEQSRYNAALDEMLKRGLIRDVVIVHADGAAMPYFEIMPDGWRVSQYKVRPVIIDQREVAEEARFSIVPHPVAPPPAVAKNGKYPFATMAVGDRFVVPREQGQPRENSFRVYCAKRAKELDRTFKCNIQMGGAYIVERTR